MYKLWAELLGNTEYPVGKREREREREREAFAVQRFKA